MKKIVFASMMLILVLVAGAINIPLTNTSATTGMPGCEPTNPPPLEASCGGDWEFLGCFTDSKGQVFESYYLNNCQSLINRPAN